MSYIVGIDGELRNFPVSRVKMTMQADKPELAIKAFGYLEKHPNYTIANVYRVNDIICYEIHGDDIDFEELCQFMDNQ